MSPAGTTIPSATRVLGLAGEAAPENLDAALETIRVSALLVA